jgi:hypothetical protein
MSGAGPGVEIRSYRAVFDLDRRIYRVDRIRLNPAGVPLRGGIYFVVLAAVVAVMATVPVAGWALQRFPWYMRYLGLPGLLAALATVIRIEGRPFHLAACGMLLYAVRPKQLSAFERCPQIGVRWRPGGIVFIPDGSDAGLRRFRFTGPGAVLIRCEHECVEWRRGALARALRLADLTVREHVGSGQPVRGRAIKLSRGAILSVRPPDRSQCADSSPRPF